MNELNMFLYIGIFMVISGTLVIMISAICSAREAKKHPSKQEQDMEDMELPIRFMKACFVNFFAGLLLIAIWLNHGPHKMHRYWQH